MGTSARGFRHRSCQKTCAFGDIDFEDIYVNDNPACGRALTGNVKWKPVRRELEQGRVYNGQTRQRINGWSLGSWLKALSGRGDRRRCGFSRFDRRRSNFGWNVWRAVPKCERYQDEPDDGKTTRHASTLEVARAPAILESPFLYAHRYLPMPPVTHASLPPQT
jgi:hypothetical protein